MAQAMACWRMRSANISRRSGSSSFESRSPRTRYVGSRMTAAATTGPNREPRPTSSTPATKRAPHCHALFSYRSVHRSLLSRRSFAVAAETGFSGTSFALVATNERYGHLRPYQFAMQLWKMAKSPKICSGAYSVWNAQPRVTNGAVTTVL